MMCTPFMLSHFLCCAYMLHIINVGLLFQISKLENKVWRRYQRENAKIRAGMGVWPSNR